MVTSLSPCHPWLASSLVIYATLALFWNFRGFSRRELRNSLSTRDRVAQWLRTSLSAFEPGLVRIGAQPIHLTLAQLGISVITGFAYAVGCIFLGGWLLLACGVLDLLDGNLARHTAQTSRRGAFLDSVIDRYAEFFTFCGLGVFFSRSGMLWIVAFAFLGSVMVSYTRARAEGLGIACRGGLMQRGERYILLGLSSFLSVICNHVFCRPTHIVLILGLTLLMILSNLTAFSRIRMVSAALEER